MVAAAGPTWANLGEPLRLAHPPLSVGRLEAAPEGVDEVMVS